MIKKLHLEICIGLALDYVKSKATRNAQSILESGIALKS
jgi:hypothetical protein